MGWYPFNGNANDESGNGNHGIVNGLSYPLMLMQLKILVHMILMDKMNL